jgi:hypothetical protein
MRQMQLYDSVYLGTAHFRDNLLDINVKDKYKYEGKKILNYKSVGRVRRTT